MSVRNEVWVTGIGVVSAAGNGFGVRDVVHDSYHDACLATGGDGSWV